MKIETGIFVDEDEVSGKLAIEVSRIRALRGPNLWISRTVIEVIVCCDVMGASAGDMPGFLSRLRDRCPQIDFLPDYLEAGTPAHALERAAFSLQMEV